MGIADWIAGLGFIWLVLNALIVLFRFLYSLFYVVQRLWKKTGNKEVIKYSTSTNQFISKDQQSLSLEELESKYNEQLKETGVLPELEVRISDETTEDLAINELKLITNAIHKILIIATKSKSKATINIYCKAKKDSVIGSSIKAYCEHLVTVLEQENGKGVIDISLCANI